MSTFTASTFKLRIKELKQVRLYESEYVTGVLDWLKEFGAIVLGVHVIKNCEKSLELCIEDKHVLRGIPPSCLSILNMEFGARLDWILFDSVRHVVGNVSWKVKVSQP